MTGGRIGVILLLTALAAGCSSGPTGTGPDSGSEPVIIKILSGTDTSINAGDDPLGGATGIYAQLVNWWNRNRQASTKITIELDTVRGGATIEHSQMVSEAQAGTGDIDIYNLDSQWIPEFVRGGYLHSLQDLVKRGQIRKDDFLPKPWASALDSHGQLFAVPFTTDAGLLYYRTDMTGKPLVTADTVGKLKTFGDLLGLAGKVMQHPPEGITEGYVGQSKKYEGLTVNALEAIWSYTPQTFTGLPSAENPAKAKAKVTMALMDLVRANPSSGEGGYDEAKARGDFADGKAALMRNWPIHYARILAGGPGTIAKEQFKVSRLPYPSVLGGQDLAISRNTKNLDAAIQVVRFLTEQATQRCLFAVGGFPATRDDAYDEDVNGKDVWPDAHPLPLDSSTSTRRCGATKGNWTDIGPTIREAVAGAQPRPAIPYYAEFSDLLASGVYSMFPGQGGDTSDVKITKLIDDLRAISANRVAKP